MYDKYWGAYESVIFFLIKEKRESKQLKLTCSIKKDLVEYMMILPYGRLNLLCRSKK